MASSRAKDCVGLNCVGLDYLQPCLAARAGLDSYMELNLSSLQQSLAHLLDSHLYKPEEDDS